MQYILYTQIIRFITNILLQIVYYNPKIVQVDLYTNSTLINRVHY